MNVSSTIGFVLSNLPAFLFVLALVVAILSRGRGGLAHRFLDWILLLPVGVTALWAALYHLAFPLQAASYIGWQPSPFQLEVGMADLAIGVVACIAFRSSLSFKGATIWVASIFLLGDAIGHVRSMLMAANFAPAMRVWYSTWTSSCRSRQSDSGWPPVGRWRRQHMADCRPALRELAARATQPDQGGAETGCPSRGIDERSITA